MPAQQDDLKRQLRIALCDQCVGIRQRRRLVEERWLLNRRAWMNFEVIQRFMGSDTSTQYRIPMARRALERSAVRCVKLLTPKVKWFEVAPMSGVSATKVSNVDKFMWYVLRKKIKSRTNISQLVRSMMMFGLCHLKTSIMMRNKQVWPTHRVIDPFAFYQFPETAATTEEAEVIFEDFLFSYERYRTFVAKGIVDDISRDELDKPDWPYHLVERMAYQGITDPTADVDIAIQRTSDILQKSTAGFVSLTEMWITRDDKLYQVYIAWNLKKGARIVGFIESVYDEPLYRSAVHRPLPGETYTNSMMEDITELDSLANDQLNKFQEAVDREQGLYMIDEQAAPRSDQFKVKGGALWKTNGDPREIMQFVQPPNTSNNQLRAWQIYSGYINSMGGSGTIAEGQPGRNMPRAGNAVQSLITLGLADLQDVAELIEQEVLTPGLSDIYKVSRQFIPDDQLMKIPGGSSMHGDILKKADIIGDYEFEWIGSLQSQDDMQRAQRSLIFLNMLPQLDPMVAKQGYIFDVVALTQMIWRDNLGERGLADILIPLKQLQAKMAAEATAGDTQQMLQGGQQGGQQNSNGNAPPASNGVPGLKFNLPSVANGFVQQT